jgi:hypothetical protein
MRDHRDAKVMAQTMRDELAAKGVSISVGESLEIVSHMFGVADWNTLSALIQKRRRTSGAPASPPDAESSAMATDEVSVAPQTLDRYVGHYQVTAIGVLAVTREGGQLSAQLTGQAALPIYPRSTTEFFYKAVDAQISFIAGADGSVTSAILHQNGADIPMPRIDAAMAAQITAQTMAKVESQTQSPGTEAALRQLIDEIGRGEPDYDKMTFALAEVTRAQLPRLQPGIAGLGAVTSIEFLGVSSRGADAYSVRHEHGATHWHIALDPQGVITYVQVMQEP